MWYNNFENNSIFITGATGLIGQAFTRKLIDAIDKNDLNTQLYLLIRDREKALKMFGEHACVRYVLGDLLHADFPEVDIDYILHAAAETSSIAFMKMPVETAFFAIAGMRRILEFARKKNVKALVYLSSMEVYGNNATDEPICETHPSYIDLMEPRSSYPESKRMCENLCADYFSEYKVPAKVIRLTQTFGPGVQYNDKRVFAEFARCVLEDKDIVLHTKGATKREYLHTQDAADAIITVMLHGKPGTVYNAANEDTYCTIYEMAQMVAEKCAKGRIHVLVQEENIDKFGYAPELHLNLDTSKLRKLGWQPKKSLEDMYKDMIASMKNEVVTGQPNRKKDA